MTDRMSELDALMAKLRERMIAEAGQRMGPERRAVADALTKGLGVVVQADPVASPQGLRRLFPGIK